MLFVDIWHFSDHSLIVLLSKNIDREMIFITDFKKGLLPIAMVQKLRFHN